MFYLSLINFHSPGIFNCFFFKQGTLKISTLASRKHLFQEHFLVAAAHNKWIKRLLEQVDNLHRLMQLATVNMYVIYCIYYISYRYNIYMYIYIYIYMYMYNSFKGYFFLYSTIIWSRSTKLLIFSRFLRPKVA